jgi:hypothetical protein
MLNEEFDDDYTLGFLQGCNDESHAFGRLSLLRGITPIFLYLKHIGLSSPLY